jgi:hypothetical protein
MICDELLSLADGLSVTDTDAYTTYSIDLGDVTPKRDIGNGEPMAMVFTVDTAAAGSTDTTDFFVVVATSADLATGTVKLVTRRIANALLTLKSQHVLPIPPTSTPLRYLGGKVELGTGDTITVSVNIVPLSFVGISKSYADAITWEA